MQVTLGLYEILFNLLNNYGQNPTKTQPLLTPLNGR